jgi:hypothetical protein
MNFKVSSRLCVTIARLRDEVPAAEDNHLCARAANACKGGNLSQYATFSTKHDNSLIQQGLWGHISAEVGKYGEKGGHNRSMGHLEKLECS